MIPETNKKVVREAYEKIIDRILNPSKSRYRQVEDIDVAIKLVTDYDLDTEVIIDETRESITHIVARYGTVNQLTELCSTFPELTDVLHVKHWKNGQTSNLYPVDMIFFDGHDLSMFPAKMNIFMEYSKQINERHLLKTFAILLKSSKHYAPLDLYKFKPIFQKFRDMEIEPSQETIKTIENIRDTKMDTYDKYEVKECIKFILSPPSIEDLANQLIERIRNDLRSDSTDSEEEFD